MSKTFKDRPEKYKLKQKPKEKRFESSKGRQHKTSKQLIDDVYYSKDSDRSF